jgi:hypothetical protein
MDSEVRRLLSTTVVIVDSSKVNPSDWMELYVIGEKVLRLCRSLRRQGRGWRKMQGGRVASSCWRDGMFSRSSPNTGRSNGLERDIVAEGRK